MTNIRQLYKYTDDSCELPLYSTAKGPVIKNTPKLPVMCFPDGTVCWPVNFWLVDKYKPMRIIKGARGGTISTYASILSHIVRFIYINEINFSDLTDQYIFKFAEELQNERHPKNPIELRRKNSQTGRIIRQSLNFLWWYQDLFLPDKKLIGKRGDNTQITVTFKSGKRKGYRWEYMHHQAIPTDNVPVDVKPIGHNTITKLYDAIPQATKSTYVKKRRQNTLRLLECTGGRRWEISQLKTSDILDAYNTEMLRLQTAKRGTNALRVIPVSRIWIEPVVMFIKTYRKRLVHRLIRERRIKNDPGFLLLGESGRPLNEETITKEISILRKEAGIDEKTCAHMFRHRFITLQVAERVKDYKNQELPTDTAEVILTKVASITGHSIPMSLRPYIDLAFEELGAWDMAEKILMFRSNLEASYRQVQILKQEVECSQLDEGDIIQKVSCVLEKILSNLETKKILGKDNIT